MTKYQTQETGQWAKHYRNNWKEYVYGLVGSEISTTTQFFDECVQIAPQEHDTGLLFEAINCSSKSYVSDIHNVVDHRKDKNSRRAFILNGNFNYLEDIQKSLRELYLKVSRHTRLFIVLYNPFLGLLYNIASWIGLRNAPKPEVYLTESNLRSLAHLSGFELVRIRPSVFLPFKIPLLSSLVNKIFPIIPLVRRLSLVWIVVLRPVVPETNRPSVSIIIPARNEGGNIDDAVQRLPVFPGAGNEIIFVEGNSTDDTWLRIQEQVNKPNNDFKILSFKQPGKGKYDAVRVGFDNATGDLITILDADLTMPPEILPRFYEAYCEGLGDFINGSRLVYPMENDAMRHLNRVGNIFFCKLLAWILGIPITDTLCGTKFFSRRDYKRIVSWRQRFGDFDPFGDFEMLFASSELALGVVDLPVRYRARTYGETNISRFRNGFELIRMTMIGFFRMFLGKLK